MSVGFSEYRCKKKYKSKRRNIPVFRVVILFTIIGVALKLGAFQKVLDMLPLPDNGEPVVELTWEQVCQSEGGTPFKLKDDLVQCSWMVGDSTLPLPNAFLRYVASLRKAPVEKVHWVATASDFSQPLLVMREDSLSYMYLHVQKNDSSWVWVDAQTECRFPGLCPVRPLDWSSISISDDFDFEGQDNLLSTDIFLGLGEAPVHPVLPGIVVDAGKDSLGHYVEIDHGNNVVSRMSGMASSANVGDTVNSESMVGRLPPKDSAAFFLTVRRNGLFVRWNDFYKASHPLSKNEIAKFKKEIGF